MSIVTYLYNNIGFQNSTIEATFDLLYLHGHDRDYTAVIHNQGSH